MLLQQLQTYLRNHSPSSLEALAQHFQMEADALRGMLQPLVRKGRVRQLENQACGTCHSCSPESLELYSWVTSPPPVACGQEHSSREPGLEEPPS